MGMNQIKLRPSVGGSTQSLVQGASGVESAAVHSPGDGINAWVRIPSIIYHGGKTRVAAQYMISDEDQKSRGVIQRSFSGKGFAGTTGEQLVVYASPDPYATPPTEAALEPVYIPCPNGDLLIAISATTENGLGGWDGPFEIACVRSTDGGETYGAPDLFITDAVESQPSNRLLGSVTSITGGNTINFAAGVNTIGSADGLVTGQVYLLQLAGVTNNPAILEVEATITGNTTATAGGLTNGLGGTWVALAYAALITDSCVDPTNGDRIAVGTKRYNKVFNSAGSFAYPFAIKCPATSADSSAWVACGSVSETVVGNRDHVEPTISVDPATGNWLMFTRALNANNRRSWISTDKGVTWSNATEETGLPDGGSTRGSLRFYTSHKAVFVGGSSDFSGVRKQMKAYHLTFATNGTFTIDGSQMIDPGRCAYADAFHLGNGLFACVYERGNTVNPACEIQPFIVSAASVATSPADYVRPTVTLARDATYPAFLSPVYTVDTVIDVRPWDFVAMSVSDPTIELRKLLQPSNPPNGLPVRQMLELVAGKVVTTSSPVAVGFNEDGRDWRLGSDSYGRHFVTQTLGGAFGNAAMVLANSGHGEANNLDWLCTDKIFTIATCFFVAGDTGQAQVLFDSSDYASTTDGILCQLIRDSATIYRPQFFLNADGNQIAVDTGVGNRITSFNAKYIFGIVGNGPGQPVHFWLCPVGTTPVQATHRISTGTMGAGVNAAAGAVDLVIMGGSSLDTRPLFGGIQEFRIEKRAWILADWVNFAAQFTAHQGL